MDGSSVLAAIATFASGAGAMKIVERLIFRDDHVSKSWREYAEKMEERVDELEKKYDTLSREHADLQKELISLLSRNNVKKTNNNNSRAQRKGNGGIVKVAG